MVLNQIFQDKDYWKKDTFDRIKSELLSVKDNRFVQYNQLSATNLVCIYGKSQVGKTTLILNMIGLKDDVCKKNVSDVLRAGIARGNSSTSTAIIYSQSESNLYGLRIETLDGQNLTTCVEYFTSNKMILKLQSIRDDVEKNKFPDKGILHIYIPKDFFSELVSKNKIAILDLPGVESRNIQEKAHVESLMSRYIPISSVCIIACPANNIQSLETLELPGDIDWKNLSHKYFVVLTRSYSVENIKKYFDKERNKRKTTFQDFLQVKYKTDLSLILGAENNTKVFPLDVGESFTRLCEKELQSEKDNKEVIETRNCILSSLQESILKQKGEKLLSCIKELHTIVDHAEKTKSLQLEEKKEELENDIEVLRRKLNDLKILRDNSKKECQIIEKRINQLNMLNSTIKNELSKAVVVFSENLISNVKLAIENQALFELRNGVKYFSDKNKVCLSTINSFLLTQLDQTVVSKAYSLMGNILNIDIYVKSIAGNIYSNFVNEYENKLYPTPSGFFNKFFGKIIGTGYNIPLQSAYRYIQQIQGIIQSEIQSSIICKCNIIISDMISDDIEESKNCKRHITHLDNAIKSKIKDINCVETEKVANEKAMEILKIQMEQDNQTLNRYLKHAEKAYMCQRNEIVKKINSNIASSDRILYVLFLGVIDKDYQKLLRASNG